MNSASSPAATARAPRRINWRIAFWWMAINSATIAVFTARTFLEFSAKGFHASPQMRVSIAEHAALLVIIGIAQAAGCCWGFSFIRISTDRIRGFVETTMGFFSGFAVVLLGIALTNVWDIGIGGWIFAPTGLFFGWLASSSQTIQFRQKSTVRASAVKRALRFATSTLKRRKPRMNWRLTLWWMAVNVAGLTVAVALTEAETGFLPRGALLFLALLTILDVLQALVGGGLISLIRIGNKGVRIAAGVAVGIISAIAVMWLGAYVLWYYILVAFWVVVPSGILFGWLLGTKDPPPRGVPST